MASPDAIDDFVAHVIATNLEDIPAEAIRAAKTFMLDCFGVGLSGGSGPWADEMIALSGQWGQGDDARVWGHGQKLPAPAAALCNAYQIHNAEFDCVHEGAVVHCMTVLLGSAMSVAERQHGKGTAVSGKDLLLAAVLGVDVACHIAVGVSTGLKFFRPGTAGAFAAVTAIGKMLNFDADTLRHAYSTAYGQMCGTMQAHTEGSMLLGMQVGFNARNAVVACDMAAAGLEGPRNILEGPFGYMNLFEGAYDRDVLLGSIGKIWRITEISHKPFPSGRATHGIVDGCLRLQDAHGFTADEVESIVATVPPLIHHLVGRPVETVMSTNYARLCAMYVTAHALRNKGLGVDAYDAGNLTHPENQELARRIQINIDDNPDPNALVPVTMNVTLKNGAVHNVTVDDMYGAPGNPMTHEAHLDKFRNNCAIAPRPIGPVATEALIDQIEDLENLDDVTKLVDLMMPGAG
ncbi:MAG: MmgE/PrpD family protein [Alphaproteobacteria bacterium]|jgi:aconitate decarboxylase|nr:MmgE/PrpD family protein [Alphaproteobacteria bacterium]